MKRTQFLVGVMFTILVNYTVWGFQTKNVVIAVIDGARYTETFGDSTHQYIPNIWNKLRPLGTIYTEFYNDGVTKTCPGHASILTGTWQNLPNDGTKRPDMPTIFEYFRKEKNISKENNAVILGKSKLSILTHSEHPDYHEKHGASLFTGQSYKDDNNTWHTIQAVLSEKHPRLALVTLGLYFCDPVLTAPIMDTCMRDAGPNRLSGQKLI